MKTTTTNTTNKSAVMLRAWDIRRAAASEIGCKVSEVLFSACLRIAWAETEGANAGANAARVVSAWAALSEGEQVAFMKKCIHKAAKDRIKYSTEDHDLQFSEVPAFGLYGLHDLDEFVSETWLRLAVKLDADKLTKRNERRAAQGKRPLELVKLVYEAADASVAAVFYQDSKHSAASVRELETEDGETCSAVETICASEDDTERAAILKADMEDFRDGCDEINNRILELVGRGYTEREIAQDIGTISNVAVHKRIVKLREQLTALHM